MTIQQKVIEIWKESFVSLVLISFQIYKGGSDALYVCTLQLTVRDNENASDCHRSVHHEYLRGYVCSVWDLLLSIKGICLLYIQSVCYHDQACFPRNGKKNSRKRQCLVFLLLHWCVFDCRCLINYCANGNCFSTILILCLSKFRWFLSVSFSFFRFF